MVTGDQSLCPKVFVRLKGTTSDDRYNGCNSLFADWLRILNKTENTTESEIKSVFNKASRVSEGRLSEF